MRDYQRVPRVLHALMLALLLALSLSGTAFADDDEVPAYQVYDSLQDASSSVMDFNVRVMTDLAGRWFYADSAKQGCEPLVQRAYLGIADGSLPALLEDAGNPTDAYLNFSILNAFSIATAPLPLLTQVYNLVTLDGGDVWDTSSAGARDEYRAWYEYFEGASGGSGGGSGGGSDGPSITIPSTISIKPLRGLCCNENGSNRQDVFSFGPISATFTNIGQLNEYISTHELNYVVAVAVCRQWTSSKWQMHTFLVGSETPITISSDANSLVSSTNMSYAVNFIAMPNSDFGNQYESSTISLSRTNGTTFDLRYGNYDVLGIWMTGNLVGSVGSGDPVYPTPPSEPLPNLPGDGATPTINIPLTTQPTYEGNGTSTTTVDLTPILEALRTINTNLVTGLDHFEDVVNDQFTALQGYLQTWFEWWKDFFTGWRDTWQEWERDFMRECNRANRWLERIYYKTGSGNSSRPDPSVNPVSTVNWWDSLGQKFLSMLPAAVSEIVSQLSRLNSVFPFSIPWDVGAILGLFSQPAATPVFELYINFGVTNWTAHINLTQWNSVALVIRRCELFVFAIQLMMWTPDVIKQMGVN